MLRYIRVMRVREMERENGYCNDYLPDAGTVSASGDGVGGLQGACNK